MRLMGHRRRKALLEHQEREESKRSDVARAPRGANDSHQGLSKARASEMSTSKSPRMSMEQSKLANQHSSLSVKSATASNVPQSVSEHITPEGCDRAALSGSTCLEASGGLSGPIMAPLDAHDAITLLSVYLSAIIHDYDHRGLTNPFLIQDEDPLAVSYQ